MPKIPPPIKDDELKWVLIDFDKTIAPHTDDYSPLEPYPGAVEGIQTIAQMGLKPTIFTSRHSADYRLIEQFCEEYGIPIRRILNGKPLGLCYIDDKNIAFDNTSPLQSWSDVVQKVKEFHERSKN